jgi:hypothetical protein
MSNFIETSNIVHLHQKIKENVNISNIFSNDEESIKYLIRVMNDIYSEKSFINNLQILNQNTLEEYVSRLLPDENESNDKNGVNELETENKINSYKIYINSNILQNNYEKNNYNFKLQYEYQNVKSIELEYAKIPKSQYIINDSNNKIFFQDTQKHIDDNFFIVASIESGNYNFQQLAEEFQDAMNLIGNSKYIIKYNDIKSKLEIMSDLSHEDKIFNLKFNSTILGFNTDKVYEGKRTYLSSNLINLNTNDNIDLVIKNLNIKLGKLYLDCDQNKYSFYNKGKYEVKMNFNQEIDTLKELDIIFLDQNNNHYNFNNFNHELIFKIETIN